MPFMTHDDIRLHYQVLGEGPPLLLIAGMASDGASWAPLLPLLSPHFSLILPDNRTTGQTAPWDAPNDLGRNARDCAALLRHLGTGPAHVLGHSMGGMIGLELAGQAENLVQSLTIAASVPMKMPRNEALFEALIAMREDAHIAPDLWLKAFYPWLFKPSVFEDPGALDAAAQMALAYPHLQSGAAMRRQMHGMVGHDFDAMKRGLKTPMQALVAEHDILIAEADMRRVLPEFGDMQFHRIMDAGHSLHWDQPEQVADQLIAFVKGLR